LAYAELGEHDEEAIVSPKVGTFIRLPKTLRKPNTKPTVRPDTIGTAHMPRDYCTTLSVSYGRTRRL
jgi:hypothetical protein